MADVILVCAEPDRAALAPVVARLGHVGIESEIWSGLENDAFQLGTMMDQRRGDTVYGLCIGPRIERAARPLEGVFRSHRGPGDSFIIVDRWADEPATAVAMVMDALSRGPQSEDPEDTQERLRDVLGPAAKKKRQEPRHQRAPTYGRQSVPDAMVQRLAQDHADRIAAAPTPSAPASVTAEPPPGTEPADKRSMLPLVIGAVVLIAIGVAVGVAL